MENMYKKNLKKFLNYITVERNDFSSFVRENWNDNHSRVATQNILTAYDRMKAILEEGLNEKKKKESTVSTFTYFICYRAYYDTHERHGDIFIHADSEIKNKDDIENIRKIIIKETSIPEKATVIITFFHKL